MHARMQVLELHQWLSSASVPKTAGHILLKENAFVSIFQSSSSHQEILVLLLKKRNSSIIMHLYVVLEFVHYKVVAYIPILQNNC